MLTDEINREASQAKQSWLTISLRKHLIYLTFTFFLFQKTVQKYNF